MSISRADGLNMRLDMMAEGILSLPRDMMAQVFKWLDLHTLATRIQRTWRGYDSRMTRNVSDYRDPWYGRRGAFAIFEGSPPTPGSARSCPCGSPSS